MPKQTSEEIARQIRGMFGRGFHTWSADEEMIVAALRARDDYWKTKIIQPSDCTGDQECEHTCNAALQAEREDNAMLLKQERAAIEAELQSTRAALVEHEASFNLRWNSDMRAIKRWQEAHPGNELVWPDHTDLSVWLMTELASARSALEKFTQQARLLEEADDVLCNVQQLVDGWYVTTPANEWSEWDEQTRRALKKFRAGILARSRSTL